MIKVVKGFKAFNKNMECRGFKFKVGETYEIKDKLEMCKNGFHFCQKLFDVYKYYEKSVDTLIAEVEALGEVETEGDKSVTNKIKIVRLLTDTERLEAWIVRNNTGDYNTGDYNTGHRNSGFFNTETPKVRLFDKETTLSFDSKIARILMGYEGNLWVKVKPVLRWVSETRMTEEEKNNNPSYKITGGFLKKTDRIDYSGWNNEQDLNFFKSLPGFDADKFLTITGIDVRKPKTIKVVHDGQEFEIDLEKAIEIGIVKKQS